MCLFLCACLFVKNLPVESLKDEDELVFLSRQSQDIYHFLLLVIKYIINCFLFKQNND